jgi:phage terminase large subunit GpA-like protein
MVYVGPSKQFLEEQFEPRFVDMLGNAPGLREKRQEGKRERKTLKWIGGVKVRLAHAGSSGALKSDPFGLAIVDEYDEMASNVRKQGDPLGLVEARGYTYADSSIAVSSTPSRGLVETEIDEESGLEFWKIADVEQLESPIWRLFQSGTRHHWAVPCPHCETHFIPRFKNLKWPAGATPAIALRTAFIECPSCGCEIKDNDDGATKRWMNDRGVYVAPGQAIVDGEVVGPEPENTIVSYWVSGLCSPFVTFGQRAEQYLRALGSGEADKIQTAINAGFGEVYSFGAGEAPAVNELQRLKSQDYGMGDVHPEVAFLTLGVDVHKTRINWVVRGWGTSQTSWLVDRGEIWGRTGVEDTEVWDKLDELLDRRYDGLPIKLALIDSGFKPNASSTPAEHRVYDFCRRHSQKTYATKGLPTARTPIEKSKVDVMVNGKKVEKGLTILLIDTDHVKSWVYARLKRDPALPGAWHLPIDIDEDYCRQIVSEARILQPNGKPKWVPIHKNNHFLDCEALAYAAASMLGVERLGDRPLRPGNRSGLPTKGASAPAVAAKKRDPFLSDGRSGKSSGRRGWLDR